MGDWENGEAEEWGREGKRKVKRSHPLSHSPIHPLLLSHAPLVTSLPERRRYAFTSS